MSDRPPLESFLKWKLSIESPSLKYAAKAVTRNLILALDIPFPLLKAWHEFLRSQKKESKTAVESQPHDEPSTSASTSGTRAGMVQNLYAKAKGGSKREELNSKVRRLHIFEGQTVSVPSLREENEAIRDELEEWKQSYKDLKSETKQLFEEM